jgi:hypothetical protein
MSTILFISYCHKQGNWVWDRLVPCLRAGGADVRIDRERFKAGTALIGQMDATQDMADINILVFSPDYFKSRYCVHEMNRAIDRDPEFKSGTLIPVKRVSCAIPRKIKAASPLYVDLSNDQDAYRWNLLFQACRVELGTTAPNWLNARDSIVRFLQHNESINLVVLGNPKWRELIGHIDKEFFDDLYTIDLESGATASQQGLWTEILKAFGVNQSDTAQCRDLVELDHIISSSRRTVKLVIKHFDLIVYRPYYDVNLFLALRSFVESKQLTLLFQSRSPVASFLPRNHPFASIKMKTVELKGHK